MIDSDLLDDEIFNTLVYAPTQYGCSIEEIAELTGEMQDKVIERLENLKQRKLVINNNNAYRLDESNTMVAEYCKNTENI